MKADFTGLDNAMEYLTKVYEDNMKQIYEAKGEMYITEEMVKQRKYSYYRPNREFSGNFESAKLKKVDDGTFIDNGYR